MGRNCRGKTSIVTENGNILSEDRDKAMAFNAFFFESIQYIVANNATSLNGDVNIFRTLIPQQSTFVLQKVNRNNVEVILNNLNCNKGPGYDNITPKMLLVRKELGTDIVKDFFNMMIDDGNYPDVLKIHKIIPILKTVGASNIVNFRPTSIFSITDNVIEKLIYEQISDYVYENRILFERQFGFKKGLKLRKLLSVLWIIYMTNFIVDNSGVAAVFFDYSKAFDLVNNNILVQKLVNIGVSNTTLEILRNYLRNRTQFVQISESKIQLTPVFHKVVY